jgi:prepilin-type N-terminal cleavage/methylation domain-containing protein
MKNYSQFLKFSQFSKGFTLVELLTAMSLTLAVFTVAGSGLVMILNADQKSALATDSRTNLSRALDFIADEIRGASKVSAVPSGATFPTGATSRTGVLLLTVPPTVAPNANKVYFVGSTASYTTYTNWASPNIINRAEGTFTSSAVAVASDGLLVDGLANVTLDATTCSASKYKITVTRGTRVASACLPASDAPSACTTNGGLQGANGFFACIAADNRTVDLYLYGQISDTNPNQYTVVKTRAFARNQ